MVRQAAALYFLSKYSVLCMKSNKNNLLKKFNFSFQIENILFMN